MDRADMLAELGVVFPVAPSSPAEQASGEFDSWWAAQGVNAATSVTPYVIARRAWDAALSVQHPTGVGSEATRPVVEGWSLCIWQSERDKKPAVWATDGSSYVWVADLAPQQPTGEEE